MGEERLRRPPPTTRHRPLSEAAHAQGLARVFGHPNYTIRLRFLAKHSNYSTDVLRRYDCYSRPKAAIYVCRPRATKPDDAAADTGMRAKGYRDRMKKACMVIHSHYPLDPRVRREAEALLDAGWVVDVICLQNTGERRFEECDGALVYRSAVQRHHGSRMFVL